MSKAGEVYNVPRGTAYLTTQQIITYTTYLIFYVALARILRPDEVGQVSLLLAAQAAFVALTQLGLPSAATRYISGNIGRGNRQTAGAVARTILRLSILVGAISFAIAALISPFVGPSLIAATIICWLSTMVPSQSKMTNFNGLDMNFHVLSTTQ